jgi:hypothetical protein
VIVSWLSHSRTVAKRIAIIIGDDPRKTHRPVEALRIALGLSAGDHDTTVVLLGPASILLTDEIDDVVDVEILEKYRPSFQQLAVPFLLEEESHYTPVAGFSIQRRSQRDIRTLLESADRSLVFV